MPILFTRLLDTIVWSIHERDSPEWASKVQPTLSPKCRWMGVSACWLKKFSKVLKQTELHEKSILKSPATNRWSHCCVPIKASNSPNTNIRVSLLVVKKYTFTISREEPSESWIEIAHILFDPVWQSETLLAKIYNNHRNVTLTMEQQGPSPAVKRWSSFMLNSDRIAYPSANVLGSKGVR